MIDISNAEIESVNGGIIAALLAWAMEESGTNKRAEEFKEATGDSMFGSGNMK